MEADELFDEILIGIADAETELFFVEIVLRLSLFDKKKLKLEL